MSSFQLPTAEAVNAEAAVDQPMDLELELDILKVSQITTFAEENLAMEELRPMHQLGKREGGGRSNTLPPRSIKICKDDFASIF
jgi:hypothetical protein